MKTYGSMSTRVQVSDEVSLIAFGLRALCLLFECLLAVLLKGSKGPCQREFVETAMKLLLITYTKNSPITLAERYQ